MDVGKDVPILGLAGLGASVYNLRQAEQIRAKEVARAEVHHKSSCDLEIEQHERDFMMEQKKYLISATTSLQQHFQQLNADLISSSKEGERDMFDQRNQSFQSIILASSVMFAALSTVIIQGFLPPDSSEFIFVAYALTCSLSFAFLFLSVVLSIEVILRASSFMYHRARQHTANLKEAILRTKRKLDQMRSPSIPNVSSSHDENDRGPRIGSYSGDSHDEKKEGWSERASEMGMPSSTEVRMGSKTVSFVQSAAVRSSQENNGTNQQHRKMEESNEIRRENMMMQTQTTLSNGGGIKKIKKMEARQIALMNEKEVHAKWKTHEAEIQTYLRDHEEINERTNFINLNALQRENTVEVQQLNSNVWVEGKIIKVRDNHTAVLQGSTSYDVLITDEAGRPRREKKVPARRIRVRGETADSLQNQSKKTFEKFWSESCAFWANGAITFFYLGTISLLLAIVIWMWAFFLLNYGSLVGAIIAVLFIGISLIGGLILWISIRLGEPYKSREMRKQLIMKRIISEQEGNNEHINPPKKQTSTGSNATTTGTTSKKKRNVTFGEKQKSSKPSSSAPKAHSSAAGGGPADPNNNYMSSSSFFALPKPLQS